MTQEWIAAHKRENQELIIDKNVASTNRKTIPKKNCIEETCIANVIRGYKQKKGPLAGMNRGGQAE